MIYRTLFADLVIYGYGVGQFETPTGSNQNRNQG